MYEGDPPAYELNVPVGELPAREFPLRLYAPDGEARQRAAEISSEASRLSAEGGYSWGGFRPEPAGITLGL